MSTPSIPNSVHSTDLDVLTLVDASRIKFLSQSMADQINQSRNAHAKSTGDLPKVVRDLSDWITDVIIETTVQGASFLEVHVIDPAWTLFQRDSKGTCFIDADDQGYLWPPVEVTFPPSVSSSTWRLCQVRATTELGQANVILTFEDKIAAQLREHQGPLGSTVDQTRAEFIQALVQYANKHPSLPIDVPIRFKALLPAETFTAADLSLSSSTPASASQPSPPPARTNPDKNAGSHPPQSFSPLVDGVNISIADGFQAPFQSVTNPFLPGPVHFPSTRPGAS